MTTAHQIMSDLSVRMELARSKYMEAKKDFDNDRDILEQVSNFIHGIRMTTEISNNSDVLSCDYEIAGREYVVYAILENDGDYEIRVCLIVLKGTNMPIHSVSFVTDTFIKYEDVFNRIIGSYVNEVFDL